MSAPTTLLAGMAGGTDLPEAVRVGDDAMSSSDLERAADAVAAQVAGAPVVAVEATASLSTVVAVVGALAAGVPIVPVPPDAGPRERNHILSDSAASLLLSAAGAATEAPTGVERLVVDPTASAPSGWSRPAEPPASQPAFILYTSGTTGPPKGVIITRGAVAAGLDGLADSWEWTPEDTLVHGLPLFHVHGLVLGVLGALRVGSRLVHTVRPTPTAYAAAGGSLYFGVPTVWSRVADDRAAAGALHQARLLVSGSAALPVPVFERLRALTGQAPVERYGMTETLITIAVRASGDRRPGWVGVPITGIETRLVPLPDDDGTAAGASADPDGSGRPGPVAHDGETVGSFQVRGDTLMAGYLGLPEATAASFTEDGWFRTGDVACIDQAGYHRLVGRRSTDLIKSGGYRIGAGEVEAALLGHPAVREAAVIGEPDEDLGQVIVAYVVADGVGEADLVDFVASTLSVHKRPRRVELLESLPRNAMGKVQKARLGQSTR